MLSGCGWVSAATSVASWATASRSPRAARATGPVRISAPLPAASGRRRWNDVAASAGDEPCRWASPSTARVCPPTSRGPLAYQRTISAPISSASVRPVASTVSTASAIWVSSVHSPGSQPKPPPPSSSHGAFGSGATNSYGRAEGVAGGRGQHGADGAVDRRRVERRPRPGVAQPCSSASLRPPQKSSLSRRRCWRDLPRQSLTVRSRPL